MTGTTGFTTGVTIFLTYRLDGVAFSAETGYGFSTPIHCNNITQIQTEDLINKNIGFFFESVNEFPFLVPASGITTGNTGFGWSAFKFNLVVQIITGNTSITGSTGTTGLTITPDPENWKIIDVTDQIENHISGTSISPQNLVDSLYEIKLSDYNAAPSYNLSYLNYPTSLPVDDDKLAFGEEVLFFGSVKTDIKAIAYTTEIPINLVLGEYNSTTNPTWDKTSPVQITEVGIYDDENNLVGIGKISNPISKDSGISRTILFAIDF